MVVDLLAVFDDGARPVDSRLPVDVRKPMTIVAGDRTVVRVKLVTKAGAPVRLAGGESLVLTARTIPDPSSEILFEKTAARLPTDPRGVYRFVVDSDDTAWRGDVRRGTFDIWYRQTVGPSCVFPASTLILGAASTPPATTPPTPTVP